MSPFLGNARTRAAEIAAHAADDQMGEHTGSHKAPPRVATAN